MKSPRSSALASAVLLAALLQAASATRSKRAQVQAEAELAAELRGVRERRQAEAAAGEAAAVEEAVASQKVAAVAGEAAAAGSRGESRLMQWAREAGTAARGLCFPLLFLMRERSEHAPQEGAAPPGPGKQEPVSEDSRMWFGIVSWLASESIYLLLCVIVAYLYKTHKDWFMDQMFKDPSEKDFKKWTSPVLEPVLLWSCLCPGVRWADSMAMSNLMSGYWQAFFLFFLMCMITGLSLGLPGWILMTCFMTFFRMRLRSKFDMEQSLFCDFCGYCWCLPCLVAQEARHIEEAKVAGNAP